MISTQDKIETLRSAIAEATLRATPKTISALQTGTTPKGNALEVARVAGVLAAKRTPDLIPYCHPVPIDQVMIDFAGNETTLTVRATATAVAKTGIEMEALTAAGIAALTLYDMGKALDPNIVIETVRCVEKRGGKSDFQDRVPAGFRAAVIVTSDGTHAGTRPDRSGQCIKERLIAAGIDVPVHAILPDDQAAITAKLNQLAAEGFHLICTTGGTGLGPRDVTVEATRAVIEREIPGIAEAMRSFGQRRTPYAMLSRGIVGVKGTTVIVNFPGSSRGVKESLDAIFPGLLHIYPMLHGGGHAG